MRLLFDLLTFGGPGLVHWMSKKILEEVVGESVDEGRVRGELLELQERYTAGKLEEGEYERQEEELLEQLSAVREAAGDGRGKYLLRAGRGK